MHIYIYREKPVDIGYMVSVFPIYIYYIYKYILHIYIYYMYTYITYIIYI